MKPTNLEWEDVLQFEEVEGYGQHIWRDGNNLYYVTEEGGIAVQRVVYELPNELFTLLESGERTQLEILSKLQNDCWPPTEEEYKDFALDSLKLANQSLDQDSKICPDLLYSRLENVDEKDILTFMELDKETNPLVWSCIANYFALICYHSYQHSGEKYLPQTIESVDEETIEAYVSSYQQLIAENNKLLDQILALDLDSSRMILWLTITLVICFKKSS
ncbi:hypothetical protein HMPREF1124_0118 [Streptococcus infantis X]|uniref:Uncharacterized protein n=1 Tax=Streptococcus infantis X TaxID=997830 RepID=F9PE55_9STRE|nr:hypothetical protein HMPREF1124_0118 [Streptococcus infantis X]